MDNFMLNCICWPNNKGCIAGERSGRQQLRLLVEQADLNNGSNNAIALLFHIGHDRRGGGEPNRSV
jgi:hypothetical protein